MDDANKVWFLANGDKKVGPLSAARIVERIATGKVPSHARAWREGMIEWKAVSEIEEFQVLPTIVPGATDGTLARAAWTRSGSTMLTSHPSSIVIFASDSMPARYI